MTSAPWNQHPQVRSPAGRTIGDLLAPRPRQQPLAGFEDVYADFVDYIVRCTHRIWEQKDIGLCRTHYADDVVMHTLAGPSRGRESVVQGTLGALAAYADRQVIAEDVIWSEDAPALFYSSHRITSRSTLEGSDALYGAASGAAQMATTVADCLVRENLIVEEWLFRDNARAALQMGHSPHAVALAQAEADQAGDPQRHAWRRQWMDRVRAARQAWPEAGHPAEGPMRMLRAAWVDDLYGEAAAAAVSPSVEVCWPTGRRGWGRGYLIGCLVQLRAQLHDFHFNVEHWAARPLPNGEVAVALRWAGCGVHASQGGWGAASGREILVAGSSHYVLRDGRIVRDQTVFDELAVLRQVLGGLGAVAPGEPT
ncbi:MAG: ester cyclase [Roseateles sp.]|uniref:ester cyclase n=1 Tax=Roseateles sp. TaxID=1971397 RepID=UPI0039E9328A